MLGGPKKNYAGLVGHFAAAGLSCEFLVGAWQGDLDESQAFLSI